MDDPYKAPQAQIYNQTPATPKTWSDILFSFEGRIPRRTYWGATLMMTGIVIAIVFTVVFALNIRSVEKLLGGTALLILIPFYLCLIYSGLAVGVKRWHDRGKSGWWTLIAFVPYIGGIWQFIECGCLRGTQGPNQYGEDPT